MPFYTRHPLDTLLLSDPFFTSFLSPATHNRPREGNVSGENKESNNIRAFSPNFDVHETPKEYILEGELPGLDDKKKNLSIEFTDNNTLVIRGKIERSYTSGTPPKQLEGTQNKGAITEGGETEKGKEKEKKEEKPTEKHEDESIKYWVSERTIGSFQRSFSFPGEVDQENVKASLEHGILKIVVPKREKRAAKRIDIS